MTPTTIIATDEKGNLVPPDSPEAVQAEITETDDEGNVIRRTYGEIGPAR